MTAAAEWAAGIVGTALAAGIMVWLGGEGPAGAICRIAGALAITLSVLMPLKEIGTEIAENLSFQTEWLRQTAEEAAEAAKQLQSSAVADQISEYAKSRAAESNVQAQVEVEAWADDENRFFISRVSVRYRDRASFEKREVVARILTEECGVAAESQEHIYDG